MAFVGFIAFVGLVRRYTLPESEINYAISGFRPQPSAFWPSSPRHPPRLVMGADGLVDDAVLFHFVDLGKTRGRTRSGFAADIVEGFFQHRRQSGTHERPGAHVLRLLLHPGPVLGFFVAADDRLKGL